MDCIDWRETRLVPCPPAPRFSLAYHAERTTDDMVSCAFPFDLAPRQPPTILSAPFKHGQGAGIHEGKVGRHAGSLAVKQCFQEQEDKRPALPARRVFFIIHHSSFKEVDLEPAACKQTTAGLPDGYRWIDPLHAFPARLRAREDSPAPIRDRTGNRVRAQYPDSRGNQPRLDSSLGRRDHLRLAVTGRG